MPDRAQTPPPGFDSLPVEEQIDYVQTLWDRIAANPSRVPVPAWHRAELRLRKGRYDAEQSEVSTWEEVRARILDGRSRRE